MIVRSESSGGIDMGNVQVRRLVAGVVMAAMLGVGGVAAAGVSDGNYDPARQHCSGHADDSDAPDRVEEGCQNATLNLRDGNGDEAVRIGTQQTADGEPVDPTPQVTTGTIDPTTGAFVYFGADDNLDNGEHDSSSAIGDGPSDGGAIVVDVDPASVDRWVAALVAGDLPYLLTHPLPLVAAGAGGCADGVCASLQTQRRIAYQGGRRHSSRSVADYEGKEWDPETCAGPSDTADDCGPGGIRAWDRREGTTYVDPGLQVYEDPNPAGSPNGPYPLPAAYVGTCGVILGGGEVMAPDSPITNDAGLLLVETGC
jgi:hypothetical protein